MYALALFVLLGVSVITIASKLFILAPTKWGAMVMASNVIYEALFKRFGWKRWPIDAVTVILVTVGWGMLVVWPVAVVFLIVFSIAWSYALNADFNLINASPGSQDKRHGRGSIDRRYGGWVPAPNPHVIVNLRGPVWERTKFYDLGDWPRGHSAEYEVLVLNPTILRPEFPLTIELNGGDGLIQVERFFEKTVPPPLSGEVFTARFKLTADILHQGPVDLRLRVNIGDYLIEEILRIRSIFDSDTCSVKVAAINRWKGGSRAGFAWRGDMDMYDPSTFQSVEGLKHTLELCRRYRVASSLYLSGRLSLDKSEHDRFCKHLGVDRNTPGIDDFITFMREQVAMEPILDFPYRTEKRYALELGNHMYLHYHTHAAMDEGNAWKNMAWMGDGRYSWQSQETGSFAEQRDNALHNAKVIEEVLGVRIRSWAVPGRAFDRHTARAVEAAGMDVGSDTNAPAWSNVLRLPPPHHPAGTERLVELTKKYPGDPDNAYKITMLKYWMGLARRTRRTFIFMAHHHLLRYQGIAGTHATEEVLRHALSDCKGDFYITTLYGLGWYWERVLCPKHRRISTRILGDNAIQVNNNGQERLEDIPIEIGFSGGKKLLILVSLPPNATQTVSFTYDMT
jgi:hypothetical protein